MKLLSFFIINALILISCNNSKNPKNIILFIGDGMGLAQVTALTTVKEKPNLERLKVGGFLKTHSSNNYVTDSGASATALSTGEKTFNHAIGFSIDRKPLKNVVEYAEELGKSTGLVVTSGITHATPASFVAHVDNRWKYNEIAVQISNSSVDVLIGGRLGNFLPQTQDSSLRKDDLNPLSVLKKRMNVAFSIDDFRNSPNNEPLAYLYAKESPPRANKRPVSLKEMTLKALNILNNNPKGFFLMVEGSQIDWGCHDVDQEYLLSELLDFDNAVGAGLDFASKTQGTLIIVTADHETGGLALIDGSIKDRILTKTAFYQKESSKIVHSNSTGFNKSHHTASMVPIFAYGPLSEIFGGIHENTFVGKQIIKFNK